MPPPSLVLAESLFVSLQEGGADQVTGRGSCSSLGDVVRNIELEIVKERETRDQTRRERRDAKRGERDERQNEVDSKAFPRSYQVAGKCRFTEQIQI